MPGIKRKTVATSISKDVSPSSSRNRSTRNNPTSSAPSASKSRKADSDDTEPTNSTTSSSRSKTSDSSTPDHKTADSEVSNAPASSSSSSNSGRRTTGKLDSNLNYSDTSLSSTSAEDSDDVYEPTEKKIFSKKVVPAKKEESSKDEKQARTRAVRPKEDKATHLAPPTSGQSTSSAVKLSSSSQLKVPVSSTSGQSTSSALTSSPIPSSQSKAPGPNCSPSANIASSSDEKEQEDAHCPKRRPHFKEIILKNVEKKWNSWYPDDTQLKNLAIEMNVDFKLARSRMNFIRYLVKRKRIESRVPLNGPEYRYLTREQTDFLKKKLEKSENWYPSMALRKEWAEELEMCEARISSWLIEMRNKAKDYRLNPKESEGLSEELKNLYSKFPMKDCIFKRMIPKDVVKKLRKKIADLGHWFPESNQKLEWANELNVTYNQVTTWIQQAELKEGKENRDVVPSKPSGDLNQSKSRFTSNQIAYMIKKLKLVGLRCRPTLDVSRKWAIKMCVHADRVYGWWKHARNEEMKEMEDSEEEGEDDDDEEKMDVEDVGQEGGSDRGEGQENEEDVQNEVDYMDRDYDIDDYYVSYQNRGERRMEDEDEDIDNGNEFSENEGSEDGDESEDESDVEREETQKFPEIRKARLFSFLRRSYKRDQNPTFQSIYEGRANFGGSDTMLYNWYLQRKIRDGFVTRSASPGTNPADLTRNQRKFLVMVIGKVRESEIAEEIRIEEMEGWAGMLGVEGTKVYEFIKEQLEW